MVSPEASVRRSPWLPESVRKSLQLAIPAIVGFVIVATVYGINWRTYRVAQLITETGANVQEIRTT